MASRRWAWAVGVSAAGLAAVGGCSALTNLDGLKGSPSDASPGLDAPSDTANDAPPGEAAAFDPASLPNLVLWLDATYGVQPTDGGMTWTDRSPVAHTVDVRDNCGAPTLQTGAINGLPALSFRPGFSDCLAVSGQSLDNFTNGMLVLAVAQPQNCNSPFWGATTSLLDMSFSGGGEEIRFGRNPDPTNTATGDFMLYSLLGKTGPSGFAGSDGGTTWTNAVTHLMEAAVPATPSAQIANVQLFEDGAPVTLTTSTYIAPNPTTRDYNHIGWTPTGGSNSYYCGFIGEILLYNQVVSATDRQKIEGYLRTKWGL